MPAGWDPPKLTVHSSAETAFLTTIGYTPSTGKMETQGGDYEAIVGVDETTGDLEILVCDFGSADEDNLPRLRLTEARFDAIVESLGQQEAGIVILDPDSLITG